MIIILLTGVNKMSGSFENRNYPSSVILTDDPLRAKMLASHHLEGAVLINERDDSLVYFGSYNRAPIALIAAGFEKNAVNIYMREAKQLGVTKLLFIGECVSASCGQALRSVILADGGDVSLLERAREAASISGIAVSVQPVFPQDEATQDFVGVADSHTGGIYELAKEGNIAALSILTITENAATGEQMEEHERRSRLYHAAQLVFETISTDN